MQEQSLARRAAAPGSRLKVLIVSNMFPSAQRPVDGIFVQEQIEQIAQASLCEYDVFLVNGVHKGKIEYLKSIFKIPLQIQREHYDVVHVHYGLSGLFLLFCKPKARVFLTLHGSDILAEAGKKWQVLLSKLILKRVHKVFVLNQAMEAVVRREGANCELIPCGVDTEFFKPMPVTNRLNHETGKLIVFPNSPSRKVKNFPLFNQVLELLATQFDGQIRFKCIEDLGRSEVRDLLNTADCLLLTSFSEGSPQVVKEALACGLPVVAVPVGDVEVMMQGVAHCFVASSREPDELAALVLKVFAEPVDRNRIRAAFLSKGIYDHASVTRRLLSNYGSPARAEPGPDTA